MQTCYHTCDSTLNKNTKECGLLHKYIIQKIVIYIVLYYSVSNYGMNWSVFINELEKEVKRLAMPLTDFIITNFEDITEFFLITFV
jgi:hypothetical protein